MDNRMKGLIAAACIAVIGTAVYFVSIRMGQNEALFGARDERTSECDDAIATMEVVKRGGTVQPQMMSQKNAEYVLTTMACKPGP